MTESVVARPPAPRAQGRAGPASRGGWGGRALRQLETPVGPPEGPGPLGSEALASPGAFTTPAFLMST